MSAPHPVGPFQVTVHDRGNHQWIKILCAIGLFDFQVWRGRLQHGDLWLLLHRLETGAPFSSPFRFQAKVPIPFSPVHPNEGPDKRFLVLFRDGVEALVLYCVSSRIPLALHVALKTAWSYNPDAQGETHEGHRQELRRHPEGTAGAVPRQGGQPGEGPGPDVDEAAGLAGRGDGREVGPRKRVNRWTLPTIPEHLRQEVLAEMEVPAVARIHPLRLRLYQATMNVRRRRGELKDMGIPRVRGVRRPSRRRKAEVTSHG